MLSHFQFSFLSHMNSGENYVICEEKCQVRLKNRNCFLFCTVTAQVNSLAVASSTKKRFFLHIDHALKNFSPQKYFFILKRNFQQIYIE